MGPVQRHVWCRSSCLRKEGLAGDTAKREVYGSSSSTPSSAPSAGVVFSLDKTGAVIITVRSFLYTAVVANGIKDITVPVETTIAIPAICNLFLFATILDEHNQDNRRPTAIRLRDVVLTSKVRIWRHRFSAYVWNNIIRSEMAYQRRQVLSRSGSTHDNRRKATRIYRDLETQFSRKTDLEEVDSLKQGRKVNRRSQPLLQI